MTVTCLPHGTEEVLALPPQDIPDAISGLVKHRQFSGLVSRIHRDIRSPDPLLRDKGALALKRLGFPD